jgi:hypothetical protein
MRPPYGLGSTVFRVIHGADRLIHDLVEIGQVHAGLRKDALNGIDAQPVQLVVPGSGTSGCDRA